MADAPKPKIKVKVPKIIHQDLLAKNLEKIKEKEGKKLVVKLSKKSEKDDISKLIELVNSWILNSNFRDKVIPLLTSDISEENLKEIIGRLLGCEIFQPNSKSLKDNECGLIANLNFPNTLFIRNYSGKSVIVSILDLIFDGTDYDLISETTKINEKLLEQGVTTVDIDRFNKETKLKEKTNIESWIKFIDIVSNEYGFNLMINFHNYFDFSEIISKIDSSRALIGLNIENNYIEKISFLNLLTNEKSLSIIDSEIETKIKELSYSVTKKEGEIKKPKGLLRIKSKPVKPISESLGYISIDPNDIGEKLEVVKINLNGIDYQFLKGFSGNLYTRTSDNILIGKISGDDLLLIENYQEFLN